MRALPWLFLTLTLGCGGATPPPDAPAAPDTPAPPVAPESPAPPAQAAAPVDPDACPEGTARKEKGGDTLTRVWCETPAGQRHGPAFHTHADGARVFSATYQKGKLHGPFARRFADDRFRVRGQYEQGTPVGNWSYWDEAGHKRSGPMQDGEPHGHWLITDDQDRARQEGTYERGHRHGKWTFRDEKGEAIGAGTYDHGHLTLCEGECPLLRGEAEIVEAVHARRDETRDCYRKLTAKSPTSKGRIVLTWTLGTDGHTQNVAVREAKGLDDPDFRACMVGVIDRIQLARPAYPREVERAFDFSPGGKITDALQASGACSTKTLRPVIRANHSKVKQCLEQNLAWPPTAAGSVKVGWRLDSRGTLSGWRALEGPAEVQSCLERAIGAWTFPEGDGACNAEYTVNYAPK